MNCCTVASVRQVAAVRVLADSFRLHHPEGRVWAVLADDLWHEVGEGEPFEVVRVEDLDVGPAHFHRLALLRDERGLARAIQPLLLGFALTRRSGHVVYLDPETLVLGSLDPVTSALEDAPVALVPFLNEKLPADNRTPSSHELLLHAAVDLGLIGLTPEAGPLLDWWWSQVALDPRVARGEGPDPEPQFANQIPLLFEHVSVQDPALTVGYWNAFARRVSPGADSYTVDGRPLLTFRFTGFDYRQPWLLSVEQGSRPRLLVSEHPALAQLCETYAAALTARGAAEFAETPYRFSTLPGGVPVDDAMRRLVAAALTESATHAGPPDPFDLGHTSAFLHWLREPARPNGPPRYLEGFTSDTDPEWLAEWAIGTGRRDHGLPAELIPPPPSALERERYSAGRDSSSDPFALAQAWLVDGALTPWDTPSSLGPLGRAGKRILRRILWPYEMRQREFQRVIVDILRVQERRLDAIRAYAELLRETLEALSDRNAAERRDAAPKLAAARRAIYARLGQLQALHEQLEPELYLADRSSFRATDETGQQVMGFTTAQPGSADFARAFTETFRGPESRVRGLQQGYLGLLTGHGPVLDIGCGRGELLDLLREAGVEARGVDASPAMVEHCRARGYRVELVEGLDHLASLANGSLGAVFAAQVIEHLTDTQLVRLFELARDKLRPDGVLVAETLNPHSLQVLKTFWVDRTHTKPVFPEVALEVCRTAGFASARILFPFGSGDLEADLRVQNEYAVVASATPSGIGLRAEDEASSTHTTG